MLAPHPRISGLSDRRHRSAALRQASKCLRLTFLSGCISLAWLSTALGIGIPFYSEISTIGVLVEAGLHVREESRVVSQKGVLISQDRNLEQALSTWAASYVSERLSQHEEIRVEALTLSTLASRGDRPRLVLFFRANLTPSRVRCDNGSAIAVAVDLNYLDSSLQHGSFAVYEPYPVIACGEPLVNSIAEAMRKQLEPFLQQVLLAKILRDRGVPPAAE